MTKRLPKRLEELRAELQSLKEQLYPGKTELSAKRKVHFVPLEDCTRSAEQFLSMATDKLTSRALQDVDVPPVIISKATPGVSLNDMLDPDLEALLIQHRGITAKSNLTTEIMKDRKLI